VDVRISPEPRVTDSMSLNPEFQVVRSETPCSSAGTLVAIIIPSTGLESPVAAIVR
jgi:hypothetical protein